MRFIPVAMIAALFAAPVFAGKAHEEKKAEAAAPVAAEEHKGDKKAEEKKADAAAPAAEAAAPAAK